MRLVCYAALTGTSGVLLYLWVNIWIYGIGGFHEGNIPIRIGETILWAGLTLLGIIMGVRYMKEYREK